ncbi:LemA family protein [Zavarzinia sp.]|uniref:LemA family protein n=1 Tax=Zavarzinia sp. TaxID=2027920 RepID=UPI003BB62195|nr:LemA family protein [Zavarzinia sp.]
MFGWIVLGLVVALAVYAVATYNGLVAGRNQVGNGWKQIDVQLKRRYDLIPNLVEVAKDYMGYEQETLKQVIAARNTAMNAHTPAASGPAEAQLAGALGRFFALAESYPELKANENVRSLMEELTSTENKIAFARQHYNDSVMAQNNRIEQFPSNVVGRLGGFGPHEYFEVPAAETAPIKVSLR